MPRSFALRTNGPLSDMSFAPWFRVASARIAKGGVGVISAPPALVVGLNHDRATGRPLAGHIGDRAADHGSLAWDVAGTEEGRAQARQRQGRRSTPPSRAGESRYEFQRRPLGRNGAVRPPIHQALARGITNNLRGALRVLHAQAGAVIVTEVKFGDVAVQMGFRAIRIGSPTKSDGFPPPVSPTVSSKRWRANCRFEQHSRPESEPSPWIDVRILLPGPRRYRRRPPQTVGDSVPGFRRVDDVVDPATSHRVDRLRAVVGDRGPAFEFQPNGMMTGFVPKIPFKGRVFPRGPGGSIMMRRGLDLGSRGHRAAALARA
jgi:hypothetical protein